MDRHPQVTVGIANGRIGLVGWLILKFFDVFEISKGVEGPKLEPEMMNHNEAISVGGVE